MDKIDGFDKLHVMKNQNRFLQALSKEELIEKIIELDEKFNKIILEKDKIIEDLVNRLKKQEDEYKKLKNKLNANSQNSSKAPSTDIFYKPQPKSERIQTGRKSGGQLGHEGKTLQAVENPDIIKIHSINSCNTCSHDLSQVKASTKKYQEIDIPQIKPIITEHQVLSKTCPQCKTVNSAKPEHLIQKIQYGSSVSAFVTYLSVFQFIPLKRVESLCKDLLNLKISEGTLTNMHEKSATMLIDHQAAVKAEIIKSDVAYFDETGTTVNGKLHWTHSASTEKVTFYGVHSKRGRVAMNDFDILPKFKGVAVHDGWKSYAKYSASHALCNAHHLRELRGIDERYDHNWARKMRKLLLNINQIVDEYQVLNYISLPASILQNYSDEYDEILKIGVAEIPEIIDEFGKKKNHPSKRLHKRLTKFKTEVLLFMHNFKVPFTNNLAERDIRMVKVKQKVSGGFRSFDGAQRFCMIRGFISTSQKQGMNVLNAIEQALHR